MYGTILLPFWLLYWVILSLYGLSPLRLLVRTPVGRPQNQQRPIFMRALATFLFCQQNKKGRSQIDSSLFVHPCRVSSHSMSNQWGDNSRGLLCKKKMVVLTSAKLRSPRRVSREFFLCLMSTISLDKGRSPRPWVLCELLGCELQQIYLTQQK